MFFVSVRQRLDRHDDDGRGHVHRHPLPGVGRGHGGPARPARVPALIQPAHVPRRQRGDGTEGGLL